MRLIGIILVALGVVALLYGGFTFITQEKVVDVGPVEVWADKQRTIWIAPVVGALIVALGLVLALTGRRAVVD